LCVFNISICDEHYPHYFLIDIETSVSTIKDIDKVAFVVFVCQLVLVNVNNHVIVFLQSYRCKHIPFN